MLRGLVVVLFFGLIVPIFLFDSFAEASEETKILGVHPGMESDEIINTLSSRGFSCGGPDAVFCVKEDEFKHVFMSEEAQVRNDAIRLKFERFFENKMSESEAVQFVDELIYLVEGLYKKVSFIAAYEFNDDKKLLISCASIGACERSSMELAGALVRDLKVRLVEAEVISPDVVFFLQEKFQQDLQRNNMPPLAQVFSLDPAISTCVRGDDGAKICIYEGSLSLAPQLLLMEEWLRVSMRFPQLSLHLATSSVSNIDMLIFHEARSLPAINLK